MHELRQDDGFGWLRIHVRNLVSANSLYLWFKTAGSFP